MYQRRRKTKIPALSWGGDSRGDVSAVEKNKAGRGWGTLGWGVAIERVVKVRRELAEKVMLEQRSRGQEGANHMTVWGKGALTCENSKCKGPEVGDARCVHESVKRWV